MASLYTVTTIDIHYTTTVVSGIPPNQRPGSVKNVFNICQSKMFHVAVMNLFSFNPIMYSTCTCALKSSFKYVGE